MTGRVREPAAAYGFPLRRVHVVALLVVLLALLAAFCWDAADPSHVYFGGDQALLLAAADETLAGRPALVGAYSKDNLHHPGPLFTWLLAAVQLITSKQVWLTTLVLSVLQFSTLTLLGVFCQRLTGSLLLSVSLPLLIAFNYPFLFYARIVWNVSIVGPCLALGFWLAWEERGPVVRLAALIATMSLAAQAHMAYVGLCATLTLLAVARAARQPAGRTAATWVLSVGVLALCWSPVVVDTVLNGGGNAAALWRYFLQPRTPQPLREVWFVLTSVVDQGLPASTGGHVAVVALAGLFAVGAVTQRTRGLSWAFLLTAAGWAAIVVSVRAVPDEIQSYYLRPIWVLTSLTIIGGVSAIVSSLSATGGRVAAVFVSTIVVTASAAPAQAEYERFRTPAWNEHPLAEFQRVARAIEFDLTYREGPSRTSPRPVYVGFDLPDGPLNIHSFLYVLRRSGLPVSRAVGGPRYRVVQADPPAPPTEGELMRTRRFVLTVER